MTDIVIENKKFVMWKERNQNVATLVISISMRRFAGFVVVQLINQEDTSRQRDLGDIKAAFQFLY